ncbi:MAG TPA: YceI family protein [Solimonas sp.]
MLVSARIVAAALLLFAGAVAAAPRPLIAANSRIEFSIKEMGVTVSGQFTRFDAIIDLDPMKPETSSAKISVDIASLTTGDNDADAIAVDKPWLDKATFPQALFTSSAVKRVGPDRYEVKGALTIRGKTRAITVPLTTAAQSNGSVVASGSFRLQRSDFGIGGGEWNEGDVVANDVAVTFHLVLGAAH